MKVLALMADAEIPGEFKWLADYSDDQFRNFLAAGNEMIEAPPPAPVAVWLALFWSASLALSFVLIGFWLLAPPLALFVAGFWLLVGVIAYAWIAIAARRARLRWAVQRERQRRYS